MNPYGIDFGEKQTAEPKQGVSPRGHPPHHRNYNPNFKNEDGDPPGWFCLTCYVGLKVIEYCLQCQQCGLIVIKNLCKGWNNQGSVLCRSDYNYEEHYKT